MIRRFIAALVLAFLPAFALADDTLPAQDPASQDTSAAQASSGSAASLGPQAGASSTADGSALQPAGNNPLQSGSTASNGLTASGANDLQGSAATGDLKIMLDGEAGGTSNVPATDDTGNTVVDTLALLLVLGLFGLIWRLRSQVANRFTDALE